MGIINVIYLAEIGKICFEFIAFYEALHYSRKISTTIYKTFEIFGKTKVVSFSEEQNFVESCDACLVKGLPGKSSMGDDGFSLAIPFENGKRQALNDSQPLLIGRGIYTQYLTNKF